jgi:hypothetical protein
MEYEASIIHKVSGGLDSFIGATENHNHNGRLVDVFG